MIHGPRQKTFTCTSREIFLSCSYGPGPCWAWCTLQGAFTWTVRSLRTQKTIISVTVVVRPNRTACCNDSENVNNISSLI